MEHVSADDHYREPAAAARAEIKVKGSRFIAEVIPARTETAAAEALAAIRKRDYDATHHCSAYRVGRDGALVRSDDDGEPSGTAGLPILRQIERLELTNTLVVVIRYYGGTKLGTGGLIRAYGDAAAEALAGVRVATRTIRERLRIRFAYDDTSPAMHLVNRFDVVVEDSAYGDDTALTLAIRRSQRADFEAAFVEALSGRGKIEAA